MDCLPDAPRREIHELVPPSKINSPVEDRFDHAYPSGKDCFQSSAPSVPDSKENGHADPSVPGRSVEYKASDDNEKCLISSETSPPVFPTEAVTSVEKDDQPIDQEPVKASIAAAKALTCEDELESAKPAEAIDQRDGGENDSPVSGKRDIEEPEPIAATDRGFESSPEVVDQILHSEEGCTPEQQDLLEANSAAPEIRRATELHARGTGANDYVPEETVETATESISIGAETAISVSEQTKVKDQIECVTDATIPKDSALEGADDRIRHDQDVDGLEVPEAISEVVVKDEAAVPDQIPVVETGDESTSCKADDTKTKADKVIKPSASQSAEVERNYPADDGGEEESVTKESIVADKVIEPSASQSAEVERSYPADDGGEEESVAKESIVAERGYNFDESAPAGDDDRVKDECAEVETTAPDEQHVTETPCNDKKIEDHDVIEPSLPQTLAEERSDLLSDEPVTEVNVEESPARAEKDNEMSYGIDLTATAVGDHPLKDFAEPDQKATPAEENASETTHSIESTPAKSLDEDESLIEQSAFQSVEVERSFQLDEPVKEDEVEDAPIAENEGATERSFNVESTPAADDEKTDRSVNLENSVPIEENVKEPLYNVDESTPAVSDDHQTKEDDEVVEPSTPQILEADKISHSHKPVKEDAVEQPPARNLMDGNHQTESTPAAASDVQFAQKLDDSSSLPEENVCEATSPTLESTPAATADDNDHHLHGKEGLTEAEKLPTSNESSYAIEATIPSSCYDQRVDQNESREQKTELEVPEDESKSEGIQLTPAPQSVDQQTERGYNEAADSDSKGILNLDDPQTSADQSSPAYTKEEGIELPTLDPTSHKIIEFAPQPPQTVCEDSTAVKGEPELPVTDREPRGIHQDDGAPKVEGEQAATEPHKPSFLGKLIDKVTGKNK